MKKTIFTTVIASCFFAAFPLTALGEELGSTEPQLMQSAVGSITQTVTNVTKNTDRSAGKIVSETASGVQKTAKDSHHFLKETTKTVTAPAKEKAVTSTVKNASEIVGKSVNNTLPAANTAVKEMTDVTDQTISEIDSAVGKQLEEVEKFPVVAPITEEAGKSIEHVTETAEEVVKETGDAVDQTVESITDTTEKTVDEATDTVDRISDAPEAVTRPVEQPSENENAKPEKPSDEAVPEYPAQPDGNNFKDGSDNPALPVKETTTDGVKVKEPFTETKKSVVTELEDEKSSTIRFVAEVGNKSAKEVLESLGQQAFFETITEFLPSPLHAEPEKSGRDAESNALSGNGYSFGSASVFVLNKYQSSNDASPKPVQEKEKSNPAVIQSSIPSQHTHGGAGTSKVSGGHGSVNGMFFAALELLHPATEKLRYYKNGYALIQWFHTPLGKPPKFAPFLNVI